jgi:hypothetical protein
MNNGGLIIMEWSLSVLELYKTYGQRFKGALPNTEYTITIEDGYYDLNYINENGSYLNKAVCDGEVVTIIDECDDKVTFLTEYDDKLVMSKEMFKVAAFGYDG